MSINATVIFCDDIRFEVGGTESLIGVRSDVFEYETEVEDPVLGKLGVFAKLSFKSKSVPDDFYIKIIAEEDREILNTGSAIDVLKAHRISDNGKELGGIHFSTVIANLPIFPNKAIRVYLGIDGGENLIGELMFIPKKATSIQPDA